MEMRGRLQKTLFAALTATLAICAVDACSSHRSEDEALFERVCGTCHSTDTPLAKRKTFGEWERTVKAMVAHGARADEAEATRIAQYLYRINPK